jgi:hypothetical protein
MRRTLIVLAAMSLPLGAASAHGWTSVNTNGQPMIEGSGHVVRQPRPVGNIDRVELTGSADLDVSIGPASALWIEADDNLLPLLTTEVRGGRLVVGTHGSYRTHNPIKVHLTVPDIRSVSTTGSGDAYLTGVANRQLELVSSGSGNFRVLGTTGELEVRMQGSGDADVRSLRFARADVSVMGSGNAMIAGDGAVRARAFGSGNVIVSGHPASLEVTHGGSGRVIVRP